MTLRKFTRSLSLKQKFNVDVLWNVGSLVILGMSGIVMNLLIARFQGSESLGIFNQVFAFYIVMSQLAVGGLQLSVLKHMSHHQDDLRQCSEFASAALVLIFLLSLIIGAITFCGANLAGMMLKSPGVAVGLRLIAPGLLFFALNKALLMILNGMRHMRAFAIFQAMRYVMIVLCIGVIMYSGYPGSSLAFSFTAAEFLLFVGLILYVNLRVFRLTFSPGIKDRFMSHVSFGTRGFMSGVLSEMNTRVDVLMLGYFMTDAAVGIYSFAAIWAEGIAQLSLVVRQNVDPILGRHFAKGTLDQIPEIAHKVRKVFYPIMGLIGLIAIAGYPLIITLFASDPAFYKSWGVFAILMTGIAMNAGYRPFLGLLLQGGRPGSHTILVSSLVLCNIVLNSIFIPIFGMYGAALATSLVFVLEGVFLYVCARKFFQIAL